MENNCFFKIINIISLFSMIYFSLEYPVTYIQYGKTKTFYNIESTSIFALEIYSVNQFNNVEFSIKIAKVLNDYEFNLKYKFFEEYNTDVSLSYFSSLSYFDLENKSDGTKIYTYTICKESDSFGYLLFNLGCNIYGEVTISSSSSSKNDSQIPYHSNDILIPIIFLAIILVCIIACIYRSIKCCYDNCCENYCGSCNTYCCYCDDCSCCFNI